MCKPEGPHRALHTHTHSESTHFEQIDLTVRVVVVLKAIKGVVVSVAVDGTHSWTRRVAAVKIATVTHAVKTDGRTHGQDRHTEFQSHVVNRHTAISQTNNVTADLLWYLWDNTDGQNSKGVYHL